jgi:DNA invertase Pin-like site-specific DNA recombinase
MKKKIKLPPGLRVIPSGQTKIAFSYIRFSSKKQEHGNSLVRQLKVTREYCKAVGLTLDESKSFRDLGVSGWKGKNQERGFGKLLDACETGLIPRGSALVVEALDRISRQRPRKVATLFSRLLDDYGLEVHLTGINKVVYPDSPTAADEAMDLLLIAMLASRASDEQETKSERLKEAFADKRERVGRGEVLMETKANKMPWWVEAVGLEKGQKPKIVAIPERAKVVKLIYKWTAEGITAPAIARNLHVEGVPTWRPKTKNWTSERVRDVINSRAPEGILQETPKTRENGLTFSIPNYYPKLVGEDLAIKARFAMSANRRYGRGHEVKGKNERPINIMRGLIRHNDRWCRYSSHANGKDGEFNGYYTCYDELASRTLVTFSSTLFEPTLLAGLVELRPGDLAPEEKQADPAMLALALNKSQLAEVEKKIKNLPDDWEAGLKSPSLAKRLQEREKEQLHQTRRYWV